jgi:preprotein translocase subunit SecA
MEVLERIWEVLGAIFGGMAQGIERGITSIFGSANARYLKKLQPRVAAINALEPKFQAMSDPVLRQQTAEFQNRLAAGETVDDLLVEAFAACRESGRRYLNMRHFDVQLLGGMILHGGDIAEMVTGEGKTLVATLPAYLNALAGKGVHVVTVNDYLARRDMEWMGPLYMGLGMTVGAIQAGMDPTERQAAYSCDITYGTNNEFGFDYLRDNMKPAAWNDDRFPPHSRQCQKGLHFAIIDEVDNILIDEARTPLIISGPAFGEIQKYSQADKIARQLHKDEHFEVKEKEHTVHLTEEGVRTAERLAGVESFYTAGNMDWPHMIDNALKAHHLYKRDVNYVVENGEVVIVDEFTGRKMPGRQWSDGLHQAVEAKESVRIKEETQTLATITLQNFFKLYKKICGMTGTAMTEAGEFWKIYKLDVIAVPTNKVLERVNHPDVIFRSEREKYDAIVDDIERTHKFDSVALSDKSELVGTLVRESDAEVVFDTYAEIQRDSERKTIPRKDVVEIRRRGRPILVGTVSIEKSEKLSAMLDRRGINHAVLNAKFHKREAEIVAQAGRKGAVTIATNMAGRGTDIILGGNPEAMAWAQLQSKYATRLDVPSDEWTALVRQIEEREQMRAEGRQVAGMGGLYVLGTERHEARRIDLQLRGRCGRQGDPGSSRFYLCLEDDLMRIFAGEWVKNILTRLGMQEGEAIESRLVSRRIEGAQKKVEERNFDIRKHLLEYDEVMDEQRKRVYRFRQDILDGANVKGRILSMIDEQVDLYLDSFLNKDYGAQSFAAWAGHPDRFGIELESGDFRGVDFQTAVELAREEAERQIEGQVFDAVEENLPEAEPPDEWNWEALAHFANRRWKLNLRDRDLKKAGREGVAELIMEGARKATESVDCTGGERFLTEDFSLRTTREWAAAQLGIDLPLDEIKNLEPDEVKDLVKRKARASYDDREVLYPVLAGIYRFTLRDATGQKRYDRESLVSWARDRFGANLDVDDLRNRQKEEIKALLLVHSQRNQETARKAETEVIEKLESLFSRSDEETTAGDVSGNNGVLDDLSLWLQQSLNCSIRRDELATLTREKLESRLLNMVEERYRPEIRRMERYLVLQVLDSAWKDHLLAMDHLKASVSLRGWAQVDPKVEYKREGMRTFEVMWKAIGERVTNLAFHVEELREEFVGSTWVETAAVHESPPSSATGGTNEITGQQKSAIQGSEQVKQKIEPIRNRGPQVGRNDPCPCGSGKKYKNCCLRR